MFTGSAPECQAELYRSIILVLGLFWGGRVYQVGKRVGVEEAREVLGVGKVGQGVACGHCEISLELTGGTDGRGSIRCEFRWPSGAQGRTSLSRGPQCWPPPEPHGHRLQR